MFKKKLLQMMAVATLSVVGVGGFVSVTKIVQAKNNSIIALSQQGNEDCSLVMEQGQGRNELVLSLATNPAFNKSIASLELSIQFDSSAIEMVTMNWDSQLSGSYCDTVYDKKTGVLKLFVLDKKNLIDQGVIQLGSITVESNHDSNIITALILDDIQIVDLNHKKHSLIVERESHTFECLSKDTSNGVQKPDNGTNVPDTKPTTPPEKPESLPSTKPTTPPQNPDNNPSGKPNGSTNGSTGSTGDNGITKPTEEPTEKPTPAPKPSEKPVTVKVNNITLSKTKLSLLVKEKHTLKAKVTPTNAKNKQLVYKSSNPKVATISSKGVITAKKPGTTTITVMAAGNRKVKTTCKVTVSNVIVNQSKVSLKKGKSTILTVRTVKKNPKVVYQSKNTKIATVSKSGKIVAKKRGSTTILVKVNGEIKEIPVKVS